MQGTESKPDDGRLLLSRPDQTHKPQVLGRYRKQCSLGGIGLRGRNGHTGNATIVLSLCPCAELIV